MSAQIVMKINLLSKGQEMIREYDYPCAFSSKARKISHGGFQSGPFKKSTDFLNDPFFKGIGKKF